ncbi:efflux RND transporter periplasmic adaptor subunit [Sulfurimonas sp.]
MKKFLILTLLMAGIIHAQNIYATFNIEAQQSANLAFTASGLVQKSYANIGDMVTKDATLASLDNKDIKALLERAKTDYKYAKKDFERQSKIKKLIDASKFDIVAKNFERAKNALAYQEAMYEKTFLKAPFDGVIFYKDIELGDAVSGLMLKTVYKLQSKHDRKLIINFDEKYVHIVKIGDVFEYMIDGDTKTYQGKISKIYPQVNSKNRKATAEVKAKDFTVGLFGSGYIKTDK